MDELCENCGNQIVDEACAEYAAGYVFCKEECLAEFQVDA
jgi:hypothetical protein